MTKDKKDKNDWNLILADAIASGEIEFFEGQHLDTWGKKKKVLKQLWFESIKNETKIVMTRW